MSGSEKPLAESDCGKRLIWAARSMTSRLPFQLGTVCCEPRDLFLVYQRLFETSENDLFGIGLIKTAIGGLFHRKADISTPDAQTLSCAGGALDQNGADGFCKRACRVH